MEAALAVARAAWPSFAALAVYVALRSQTDAFTPASAPSYYRLTVDPALVARNFLEYADRSLTFTAAVLLLGVLAFTRRRPRLDSIEQAAVLKGLIWLGLGFGVTILIPVRSSLYVCLPTIGSALIGLGVGRGIWQSMSAVRRRAAVAAMVALPVVLAPVHWARHQDPKAEAMLSTRLLAGIRTAVAAAPNATRLVVHDTPDAEPSATTAFRGTLPLAIELVTGRRLAVELVTAAPSEFPAAAAHEQETVHVVVNDLTFARD